MRKIIFVFCLSFLPVAFTYSQSEMEEMETDCSSNLEDIFKVYCLKIKYELIQCIYEESEKSGRFADSSFLNRAFDRIRAYLPYSIRRCDSISGTDSEELLNSTPEEAFKEYRDLIRNIKLEKEIYSKCIDAEFARGDSSEYVKKPYLGSYYFRHPLSSIIVPPGSIKKLDFLKVFKEFILNGGGEVLPDGRKVAAYLKRN